MAQDVYELGSVFKIFSFAMALEDHTLRSLDEVFPIGQVYKVGKYTIHEAEHMPATLAARDILAQSSNIGTPQIALRSGPARQRAFLARLGLLAPVRTELPESRSPLYPASNWGQIETATIGFGQGISVSPLSFVAAAASVVNGGRRVTPTFLKQAAGDLRGEQVIKAETIAADARPAALCRDRRHGQAAPTLPAMTWAARPVRPRCRARMAATFRMPCAPASAAFFRCTIRAMSCSSCSTSRTAPRETGGFALAGWTAAPAVGRIIAAHRAAPGGAQSRPAHQAGGGE